MSAAMIMSPAAPLGQSKYAIFIRRSRSCRGPGGGGVRDPGQGWLDHAARVRMARGGWAPPGRRPSAGDAAGTGLPTPPPQTPTPPPPRPPPFAASFHFLLGGGHLAPPARRPPAPVYPYHPPHRG